MPQALLVSTSVPVVPAAPATPAGPAAGPADFLGQLKTALKNLTKAVKQPIVVAEAAPRLPAAAQALATDAPAAPADAPPADHTADALPDVLAALGFVPVPLAFTPPAPVLPAETAAPSAPSATGTAQLPAALPQSAPIDLPQAPAIAVAQSQRLLDNPQLPQPAAPLAMPEVPRTKTSVAAPTSEARASTAPTSPSALTTPTDLTPLTPAPAVVAPLAQPAQHQNSTVTAEVPPHMIAAATQSAHQNTSHQGSADDRHQPSSPKAVERINDDTPAAAPVTAAPDAAIAAATGSTLASSPLVLPPHLRAAEVVSQIAHQADLYRLPGNRGVRVQLHPEDLGGVEVTLRYGAGGALQLHINVEHAATGALVQAGWTELRDALATQGISPDRLVMSVTAPASSSQLDFSSGGSGRQTDPGMAGFAQSQSGQQRQDDSEQAGSRGWTGTVEPTSPSDETPRVASTSAPTSRIDYRA